MSADLSRWPAVARYFEVLNGADPETLRAVLTEDFVDEDPMAFGDRGPGGTIERVRAYRAALPDARSHVESVEPDGAMTIVVWVTSATGLDGSSERVAYRYRAEMMTRAGRIRSHRVLAVEAV